MARHDDIDRLMQRLGGCPESYREFAQPILARPAAWPLLRAVMQNERPTPRQQTAPAADTPSAA